MRSVMKKDLFIGAFIIPEDEVYQRDDGGTVPGYGDFFGKPVKIIEIRKRKDPTDITVEIEDQRFGMNIEHIYKIITKEKDPEYFL